MIDPWLSETTTSHPISRSESSRSNSRRSSSGKTPQEPFTLLSTTSGAFRDHSNPPRFASPRRQLHSSEPIEVIGSDDDEPAMPASDVYQGAERRVTRQQVGRQAQNIISPHSKSRRRLVSDCWSIRRESQTPAVPSLDRHRLTDVSLRMYHLGPGIQVAADQSSLEWGRRTSTATSKVPTLEPARRTHG